MAVRLRDLSDLMQAVKTIRKIVPMTGNGAHFRDKIFQMDQNDLNTFWNALDTANQAVNALERDATVDVGAPIP